MLSASRIKAGLVKTGGDLSSDPGGSSMTTPYEQGNIMSVSEEYGIGV